MIPLPLLAEPLLQDSRVAAQPLVDKGFASVRKIGNGVYATVSDFSKGAQTISNGGIVIGRDSALLIEGFASPGGAAFQMDVLRMVSQLPVRAALDTHYHFDHSLGNAFYGAQGIPVWAHAKVPARIVESYVPLQAMDQATVLAPYRAAVENAKNDTLRQRAQGDLNAATGVYMISSSTVIALPNHSLDPARLPFTFDLGGTSVVLESYPGHSGTDVIARIPDQNIVFTGDLLFNAWYPVAFDPSATISGWRATLSKFAAFDKDTLFVPGHGQVCGQEGIALSRGVFDDLAEHAQKMYKAGVPVDEAGERYTIPDKFKNLPVFAWSFTIGPAISKLYAEWGPQK
ncbi:MAG TPA: MBL fold metallo-hydrolase [Candidatus Sulfotelmatobacter sp.]|nr:MBL fold metallo-hydrolase [Candidatus Sulfotelmatobacter sp.]